MRFLSGSSEGQRAQPEPWAEGIEAGGGGGGVWASGMALAGAAGGRLGAMVCDWGMMILDELGGATICAKPCSVLAADRRSRSVPRGVEGRQDLGSKSPMARNPREFGR